LKKRIKSTGKSIKLRDLPEEVKTWDPPPFNFAQSLKANFEEILQEEQRYLQEITNLKGRCAMICNKVKEQQPDIIAFQEMDMFEELNPLLEAAGYTCSTVSGSSIYRDYAQRVKDLGIQMKSKDAKTAGGESPKDFAAKYREILMEYTSKGGLCFCPNFDSTARRFNPEGFDDGVAIYWKITSLQARGDDGAQPEVWSYDIKGDAPALRVKLKHKSSGTALDVMTFHLPSSPSKELRRQMNLWQLHELMGAQDIPLILAVDLNSDAHLEPSLTQEMEIPSADGTCTKAEFELLAPLRQSCFKLLQNGGPATTTTKAYCHPVDVAMAQSMADAGEFPFWGLTNAWGTQDRIPLSVVKMRGPASDQVKKWGELTLETTDHVFCSHHFRALQCETGYSRHNHQEKQDLLRRFKDPEAPNQEELAELLKGLIPSSTMPSDHMFVVAKLQLQLHTSDAEGPEITGEPTFVLGDRVRIVATKQQSKAFDGTVRFVGSTDFAKGLWLGVELEMKAGKNDGSVQGKTYFECEPEYGLFLRPSAVEKIEKDNLDSEKVQVQETLALAMEDHDVATLRRVLPEAERLGLNAQEIQVAKNIVDFVASQDLREEVNSLCSSLLQLQNSVTSMEAVAASPPGTTSTSQALYNELERRVCQRMPVVMERIMAGAVQSKGYDQEASEAQTGQTPATSSTPQASVESPAINTKQKFRQNLLSGLKATIVLCEQGGKPGHSQVPTQRIFFSYPTH